MVAAAAERSQANARAGRAYPALTQEAAVSTDPFGGMTPNDWAENEARREERVQRAGNPDGQISPEIAPGDHLDLGLLAMALVAYAIRLLGVVSIPGFNA